MDCKNCEYCDGPICGVPCSHYLNCLEHEKEERKKSLLEKDVIEKIDKNIATSMMVVTKVIKILKEDEKSWKNMKNK